MESLAQEEKVAIQVIFVMINIDGRLIGLCVKIEDVFLRTI